MLKKLLAFLLVITATATIAQEKVFPTILPQPSSVKHGNANIKFDFTKDTKIIYAFDDSRAKYAAEELNRIAVELFGKKLKKTTKATTENNIIFKFDGSIKPEGYMLDITPENIIIKAKDGAGM